MVKLLIVSCLVAIALILPEANAMKADSWESSSYSEEDSDEEAGGSTYVAESFSMAGFCDPKVCFPPECRCASTILTDEIPVEQIPQVIFSFYCRLRYLVFNIGI